MFGKCHEYVPWESGLTGPFDQWPTGLGFERFYGNVIGESDHVLARRSTTTRRWSRHRRTRTTTTRPTLRTGPSTGSRRRRPSTPDKPFFVYYAAQGMHDPVQLPEAWRDKYKGKFDRAGTSTARRSWRARRSSASSRPTPSSRPSPTSCTDWDTLSADEKKVCIRYQEVFAAFAEADRLRDRQGRAGRRGHGRAGQHPDHLCHRRQRREPQRRADRRATTP